MLRGSFSTIIKELAAGAATSSVPVTTKVGMVIKSLLELDYTKDWSGIIVTRGRLLDLFRDLVPLQ